MGGLLRNMIPGSKSKDLQGLNRGGGRENIKMKYCIGHYKEKPIAHLSVSEKSRGQKGMSLWSKVWADHVEQFSEMCHTDTTVSEKQKAHCIFLR